jgi:hypothetical protein
MAEQDEFEVLGDLRRARTDWSQLVGHTVQIALLERTLGFDDADNVLDVLQGCATGRIVGVEPMGIWFEFWDHVLAMHAGQMQPEEVPHFFIPYSNIRAVRANAVRDSKKRTRVGFVQ